MRPLAHVISIFLVLSTMSQKLIVETTVETINFLPNFRRCQHLLNSTLTCEIFPTPVKQTGSDFFYLIPSVKDTNRFAFKEKKINIIKTMALKCPDSHYVKIRSMKYAIPKTWNNFRVYNYCGDCTSFKAKNKCGTIKCSNPPNSQNIFNKVTRNSDSRFVEQCKRTKGNCKLSIPVFNKTQEKVQGECDINKHLNFSPTEPQGYNMCQYAVWVEVDYVCIACESLFSFPQDSHH